jgi:mevalonate kinase
MDGAGARVSVASSEEAVGFGHGKVILLGEHSVVYGYPALAAGLSRGLRALASPGTGRLRVPAWNVEIRASSSHAAKADGDPVPAPREPDCRPGPEVTGMVRAWSAVLARFGVTAVDVAIDGDLPAQSGLGSSAAMSFAVSTAIARLLKRDRATALAAASDAETVFHGTPSGIDLAAAETGAVGRFQRGQGWISVPVLQPMTLCVGLSGRSRETRNLVDSVRRLRERTSVVGRVIETMGSMAAAGERALASGDVDELGRLFDVAHGLLSALRVSSRELDALVHGARSAGAIGAKLTGAGGGGAVIALAPGHERDVIENWRRDGFAGFLATIAGARLPGAGNP